MSSAYSKKANNYVVVDFDNVTKNGLKSLITTLNGQGEKVETVEANNRKSKKDGVSVKRAKLIFEKGQAITLFIAEHGDIYQMALNGTKQPLPLVTTEKELAKALSVLLKKNQDKFDKSQQRKANKIKPTDQPRPLSKSLKSRVEIAENQLSERTQMVSQLNNQLSNNRGELSSNLDQISKLKALLEAEKIETKQLREQLAMAKEA